MNTRDLWTFFFCLFYGDRVREWMLLITTFGMIFLVGLSSINHLNVYGQSADFKVFVNSGNSIHDLNIKASEGPNGQVIPISGFTIDPEDVVLLRAGQNLNVMTSTNEPQRINNVKIVNQAGQFIELQPLQLGTWSLAGIVPGIYLLDIIVDTPDSSSNVAYETVLVILAQGQQPLPLTQYITMVQTVKVKVDVIFTKVKLDLKRICQLNPNDARCPKPGPDGNCPPGWGLNDDDQCVPSGPCPSGHHRPNDDETGRCVPEKDLKQCEDGSRAHPDDQCPEEPITCDEGFALDSNDICRPICDTTEVTDGGTCVDEGDPDDCEPGYVDRGFGCELEQPEDGFIDPGPLFGSDEEASDEEDAAAEEGESGNEFESGDDDESGGDEEDSSSGGEDESAGDEGP